MDVVIPYQYVNRGFELRYCLRSLEKHFKPLGNVFIVGEELPPWLTDVFQIAVKDGNNIVGKQLNIHNKTMAAISDPRVSTDFLWVNDDHYLLTDYDEDFPYYWSDILWGYAEKSWGHYRETLMNTRTILGRWARYFDCHCPIIYNKHCYPYATRELNWKKDHGYALKSLYASMNGIEGVYMEDTKIREPKTAEQLAAMSQNRSWFSIADNVLDPVLRRWFMQQYPEPSRFENLKVNV